MPCCGQTGCTCRLIGGTDITVTGGGTTQDPYVISTSLNIEGDMNPRFGVYVSGTGSESDPYVIGVDYSPDSRLIDIPDVVTSGLSSTQGNGNVLAWDSSTQVWRNIPVPTAAPGLIHTDGSLTGDGSLGANLAVKPNLNRGMVVDQTNGLGISDNVMNELVRRFGGMNTLANADPPPVPNSMAILNSRPGRLWYYDGNDLQWEAQDSVEWQINDILLNLGGMYAPTMPITTIVQYIDANVDNNADVVLLGTPILNNFAGVIYCNFICQAYNNPFMPVVHQDGSRVLARCFGLGAGNPLAQGTEVRGMVVAACYNP